MARGARARPQAVGTQGGGGQESGRGRDSEAGGGTLSFPQVSRASEEGASLTCGQLGPLPWRDESSGPPLMSLLGNSLPILIKGPCTHLMLTLPKV